MVSTNTNYPSPFISVQTGSWNVPATWGYYGTATAGLNYPGSTDNATVSTSNTVTLVAITSTSRTLTVNGTLAMAGFNVTAGSLTGTATAISSASGTPVLTVGSDNTSTTFSGIIATGTGVISLIKNGTGTLTISGANTYTGATTVNGGIIKAGAISTFSPNSAITLANTSGVALDITGYNNTIGSLTGGGTTGGNVTLGNATLTIGSDNTSPAAYVGVIGGAGNIIKTGTGTLILGGVNTYTGVTTVNAGILSVTTINNGGVAGNLGQATNAAANLVLGGETLQYTGATASTDRAFTLTATTNSTIDVTTNTLTMSGASGSASGSLTKVGSGTLKFWKQCDNSQ